MPGRSVAGRRWVSGKASWVLAAPFLVLGVACSDPAPTAPAVESHRLVDVADQVGLDFRHGAFAWSTSPDPAAMMGSGLCWLDYDDDGWVDLFVVNS